MIARFFYFIRRLKIPIKIKEALGQGKGVGHAPQGIGGAKYCVCPKCGYKVKHTISGEGKSLPCQKIKCPKCGSLMTGSNTDTNNVKEGHLMQKPFRNLKFLMEASNRSWETIDKSKLPASCFLWIEDPKKKATWHLPIYEGTGGISPETGMYKSRGQLNLNGLRAASSAIAGARAGKPMNIPTDVRARITALLKANKIGQFAESRTEVKESGKKDITISGTLKEANIDKENKIIRDVVLLSRFSANNREYTNDCLNKSIPLFEGIKAFANHSKKGETGRDIRDLIGKYENIKIVDEKVKGDLSLVDGTDWLLSIAEKMPDLVGNSIHGQGRWHKSNGKEIIEGLVNLYSVDVVTNPATTVSLFENEEGKQNIKEDKVMEWKDISISELQANRLDVYESIIAEGVSSRNDEVKTLKEENDSLKQKNDEYAVKESLIAKKVVVEKALSESKLPKEAKTDTFSGILMAVQEKKDGEKVITVDEQIKSLIEDRITLLNPKGVKGMGGDKKVIEEGKEITKEEFAKELGL